MRTVARRSAPAAALLAALVPSLASSRGGGGAHGFSSHSLSSHNYSGGGYHYGSSYMGASGMHGGSTGNATNFTALLILGIAVLVIIVIIIAARKQGWNSLAGGSSDNDDDNDEFSSSPPFGTPLASIFTAMSDSTAPAAATGLQTLKSSDQAFDLERFLQRAEMTYMLIVRAELNNSAADAKAYFSAAAFAQWSPAVEARRAQNIDLFCNAINVRRIHPVSVRSSANGDECVVHLDVVMGKYALDHATGKIVWGSPEETGFGVDLTFFRAGGVGTAVNGGTIARKCPVCNAALSLRDDGSCAFCSAPITNAPDFAPLRAADSAFDEALFIERSKAIFTAVQNAWTARDLTTGQAYMSEGLFLAWRTQIEQMQRQSRRNVLDQIEILAMIPVSITSGSHFDTVTLRIDARAIDYEVDERTGRVIFGSRHPQDFSELWSLQRAIGAKSGKHSIADKQCPRCGAPLQIGELGECEYCHAAVTSGEFDWILSRISQLEG
jgi:predicted lipid-binding transport protein (Tim44 family)